MDTTDARDYRSDDTVKHEVAEELMDLHVNRPLAARVVDVLVHTPVGPNMVTLMGTTCACLAGWAMALNTTAALGWAAAFLMSSMVFDCADGQLARRRGGGSRFGRALDGAMDWVNATALHLGMWSFLAANGVVFRGGLVDGYGLFAWVCIAGASMAVGAGYFDARKQWFLIHVTRGKAELESPEELRRLIREADTPMNAFMMRMYLAFTLFQQGVSGESKAAYIDDAKARSAFIHDNKTFIRLASFLGPGTHNALILLATILSAFFPQAFWWYVLTAAVPLNVLYVSLVFWGRHLDTRYGYR